MKVSITTDAPAVVTVRRLPDDELVVPTRRSGQGEAIEVDLADDESVQVHRFANDEQDPGP
jgi:hypothetical protein